MLKFNAMKNYLSINLLHSSFVVILAVLFSPLFGQYAASKGNWTIKNPFKNEVFIENNGQFSRPNGQNVKMYNMQFKIMN